MRHYFYQAIGSWDFQKETHASRKCEKDNVENFQKKKFSHLAHLKLLLLLENVQLVLHVYINPIQQV